MKKTLIILFVMSLLFNISGCDAERPADKEIVLKPTIAYEDREFIYNNGLEVEYKNLETEDENHVKCYSYYPEISGLKNKVIQNQLNNEITATLDNILAQLEAKFLEKVDKVGEYKQKTKNAGIAYNYNNVIFIDLNASIEAPLNDEYYTPIYNNTAVGYDLNTGNKIKLSDLFKPEVDYKNKINSFISQYIIENNFDDYSYEMMKRPYQGIREDQSFSLSFWGLIINFDEKNDDFAYSGYPLTIQIPLKYFGDDLYVFDRYFVEGKNIYDKSKLTKKLFSNKIEFIPKEYLTEGTDKWHVSIMKGEFTNISDKAIEERIRAMLEPVMDVEEFKQKAEKYVAENKDINYYGDYSHNIEVAMNAGGYLSIVSADEAFGKNKYEQSRRTFNYDFKRKKEMKLMDLFKNDIDAETIMKKHIKDMDSSITEAMLEEGINAVMNSKDFSFSEYGVIFRFSPKGVEAKPYQEWIWMDFEKFGMDNISLFD